MEASLSKSGRNAEAVTQSFNTYMVAFFLGKCEHFEALLRVTG